MVRVRRGAAAAAATTALLVAGCHAQIRVPGPEWPLQRAYLLAVYNDRSPARVWAVDVSEGGPVPGPDLALQGSGALVAIHFSCPLSALGLAPGEVALRAAPEPEVPLPRALGVQSLRFEGGEVSPWQPIQDIPVEVTEALRRLPISAAPSDCAGRAVAMSAELLPGLSGRGPAAFALPLASGQLLVGTRTQRYLLFEPTGDSAPVTLGPGGPFVGAYQAPDTRLWLLAADGRLVFGPLEGPWTVATSSVPVTRSLEAAVLVGPDNPTDPFELFAATDGRTLARYDGDRWTDLSVAPGGSGSPELVWLGPGRALAGSVAEDAGDVVWVDAGLVEVQPGATGGDSVSSLVRVRRELLMGTRRGEVRRFDGAAWTLVGATGERSAYPILPFRDTLLVGSLQGLLTDSFQWFQLTSVGLCPVAPAGLPAVFSAWAAGPEHWLLITRSAGRKNDDGDFGTVRLTAKPPQGISCAGGTVSL